MQVNTLWDRLLSLFMFVAATLLLAAPCNHCHKSQTSPYLPRLTSLHFPKDMVNPLLCSCNVKCDNVLPQGEVEPRPAHFELQPQSDSQHIHPCWCPPATVFHIIRQTFQWVLIVCQVNSYEQLWWVKLHHSNFPDSGTHYIPGLAITGTSMAWWFKPLQGSTCKEAMRYQDISLMLNQKAIFV